MKKKIYIGLVLAGLMPFAANAQDQRDALRYSQLILGGTARFTAMGGAFTALGGDASVLAYNPAALGVFTKSQLTFSTGFSIFANNATYNGTSVNSMAPVLTIQNAAWIASWRNSHDDAPWKVINFGIAYTRTNNFNQNITIQGTSNNSTMLDQFTAYANGSTPDQLDPYSSAQAYNAGGLIYYYGSSSNNTYGNIIRPFLTGNNTITQQSTIQRKGSMGETDFSFAADYDNRLYLGGTLGIANINFNESAVYSETPNYNDSVSGLTYWDYSTALHTYGGGINLKFGLLYRIADWIRIGGAVHTPTWFTMTDNYSSLVTANYNAVGSLPAGTYAGTLDGNPYANTYNYTLITPFRAMGGLAFIIHHQGIISADYEFVDYSTAQLSSADAGAFSVANAAIQQYYMRASNFRVGAEWVVYPFSIRAGFQYYGDPYDANSGNSSVRTVFTGGLGIKLNRCFIDLAYVLTKYNENYYMYDPSMVAPTALKNSASDFIMTLGVNF